MGSIKDTKRRLWFEKIRMVHRSQRCEEVWRRRLAEKFGLRLRYGERLMKPAHSFVGMPGQYSKPISKKIWIYWAQGFDNAPSLIKGCVKSWYDNNPNWDVILLTDKNVSEFVVFTDELIEKRRVMTVQAYSDVLRLALVSNHGGVWVDATAFCSAPLEYWLPSLTQAGFFCFTNCGWRRPAASWFLASHPQSQLSKLWYDSVVQYWIHADKAHQYFWVHQLFSELIRNNKVARKCYDLMPKIDASASHAVQRYAEKPNPVFFSDLKQAIDEGCIPVSKLNNWEAGTKEEQLARHLLGF